MAKREWLNAYGEGKMGKVWRTIGYVKRSGWLILFLIFTLTGCQGALLTYKGAMVREGDLIPLTDGTQRGGLYQSTDLTIEYQWAQSGNEFQLSGVVKFTPGIRGSSSMIPNFHLSLFLTDAQGKILEDRRIGTPVSSDPRDPVRFSEKWRLPPGAEKMAFSYSGQARGSGGSGKEGGGDTPFWQVPIVR
jgi:hypothetical protein